MRVELRDGQWAEFREHITHATDKHLKVTIRRGQSDDAFRFDLETEVTRAFVKEWSVRDPEGNPIPIADPDAIERAPDDIIDELSTKAAELWTAATIPKATPQPSDSSSSDEPPASPR